MNISIPLNSYVNTSDDYVIKDLETQDKDVLSSKNTLKYKNLLSPMYKKSESAFYTTSGNTLKLNGTTIVDQNSITYSISNKGLAYWDLNGKHKGKCIDAYYKDDKIYALYKIGNQISLVHFDTDLNITFEKAIIVDAAETLDAFISKTKSAIIVLSSSVISGRTVVIRISDLETGAVGFQTNFGDIGTKYSFYEDSSYFYIGFDDTDVRKRRIYRGDSTNAAPSILYYGFGTVGSNGLITGEPIPQSIAESGFSNTRLHTLDNGVLAYDYASVTSSTVSTWIIANLFLRTESAFDSKTEGANEWGGVTHSFISEQIVGGYDLNSNKYLYIRPHINNSITNPTISKKISELTATTQHVQVDFSDGLGNLTWGSNATIENGCNPFPYRFFIFNRASSRGVFWDYGKGWVRSYVRDISISSAYYVQDSHNIKALTQEYPTAIISYGLSNIQEGSGLEARCEWLDTINLGGSLGESYSISNSGTYADNWHTSQGFVYKRYHLFNPTIFDTGMIWTDFVGADNLANHSVLHALPFSVQLGTNILEQYYAGNYLSTSYDKTLLNSASFNTTESARVYNSTIFINGILVDTSISQEPKIEKISDYIYRLNTTDKNLIKDNTGEISLERGFIPYNGEEVIYLYDLSNFSNPLDNTDTDGNDVYYTAAGYNVQMNDSSKLAISYLLPAASFQLIVNTNEVDDFTFQLIDNKKELTKPVLYPYFTFTDDVVDHYYNHSLNSTDVVYQTGKKLQSTNNNDNERIFGISTWDSDKEAMSWWITSTIQIFPLGLLSKLTGVNYTTSTIDMTDNYTVRLYRNNNSTFPVYNPNTEIYNGSTIFTIYGYNYSFDGQGIYYLGSGDDTTQNNFACYALGMKFLANSGTEAYFYSSFEKRLYLFTGSNTLQIADSLARVGEVIDSVYSSHEQILYLLTSDGFIIAKSQEDMSIIDQVDTSYRIESTDTGFVLIDGWNYIKYRLYATDETEWLPIKYETEYLGKNNNRVQVHYIDVSFYGIDPIKGNLYYESIDDVSKEKTKQEFDFTKKDFSDSKIQKVRLTPKTPTCKAFKFGIDSKDYVHIADVCVAIDVVSENTNAAKHK